ncbi:tumor protein p63-regulated gene 1 protein isoform X1 [Acanthopagrus latus]|uniref:tumor protein p63-regulated gene 1 protein isoform X1 n=2 Tax=Acanthopagrus latus TaxID=8177 RepID=UPI00187C7E85|nr:tumor protein p63-regulated gene 1 protein isoform X1 [Acanthopagrus latus]XP_036969902.1 tumor protein p63-regulated gene 1 protein isoform X1 [Acanthopagrus latus]XP_036969903.1 tumor protein p63-regulated gene 1 protein isoform X1 [Acanthopagrus latus]
MLEAEAEGVPSEEQQHQVGPEDTPPAAPAEGTEERAVESGAAPSAAPEEGTEEQLEEAGEAPVLHTTTAPAEVPTARTEEPAAVPVLDTTGPVEAPNGQTEEPAAKEGGAVPTQHTVSSVESPVDQFKHRKFFVLRPGTLNQALKDVEALVDKEVDGSVHSIWLMAEVDHWNNEKERIVLITDSSLLVCKYDFVMFSVDYIQRIALNFVDRISYGAFSFPKRSLLRRDGEGVRVFWDRLREPSFISRWNPFATDFPFTTFTYHPVRNISDKFAALCDIQSFRDQLKDAAQRSHARKPVPGKANGVLLLNQNILIEAYVGLMSFLGNQNKLGYSMARGNIGF